VDVALINEKNKILGSNSITLNTGVIGFAAGNSKITFPEKIEGILRFPNVKAEDLTPSLTIVITAVNGIPSSDLNISGYMKIITGNLEERMRQREEAEVQAQKRAAEMEAVQREQNAALKKAAKERKTLDASKYIMSISAYGQMAEDGRKGAGLEADYYAPLIPFTVVGLELRIGIFDDDEFFFGNQSAGGSNKETSFIFSPVLGFVWPFSTNIKAFTDVMVEMGRLGNGLKGVFADWASPAVDAGIMFNTGRLGFTVKYRWSLYSECYTHAVGIGLNIR
jgi:hypothetical protein